MMGFPLKWPKPKPAIHGDVIPTSLLAPPMPSRGRTYPEPAAPVAQTPAERFRAAMDGLTVERLRGDPKPLT